MVSEERARELVIQLVYRCCDSLGYGHKVQGAGYVYYMVGKKQMTHIEYLNYCIQKELKKFDL